MNVWLDLQTNVCLPFQVYMYIILCVFLYVYTCTILLQVFDGFFTDQITVEEYYRRSENFCVKKLSYDKFLCKKIFVGTIPYRISVNSAC